VSRRETRSTERGRTTTRRGGTANTIAYGHGEPRAKLRVDHGIGGVLFVGVCVCVGVALRSDTETTAHGEGSDPIAHDNRHTACNIEDGEPQREAP